MDYEDNDFQNQSFQLAVEENITFSPVPHSYSLPKFDLDDNLQVHLKFDSLVESEVLLGIQSQEENQWIEDYSRESSGLEFSSGATEACSISRCNNVWSEATSSESVDLLLKSVRQEEVIVGQTMIEESANCDRLDSLENQMKPSLNQDSFTVSKTETASCVGSVSTLDEPGEQSSKLDMDVMDHLPLVDSTSLTGESGYLVKNDSSKVTGLKVDVHAINKSEGDVSPIDSFCDCIQVVTCTASVQKSANIGESYSVAPQGNGCLEKDEAEVSRVKKVFSSSQTHEGHLVDTDNNNLGNMSSFIQKVGSSMQVTELSSDAIFIPNTAQIAEYENTVLSKSADMIDQFIVDLPKVSPFTADGENICVAPSAAISVCTIEDHSIQTNSKSDQTTHGYSSVGTVVEQENLLEDVDHRLNDGISMCDPEILPVKEKNSEGQVNEDINDNIGDSFDLVVNTGTGELNSDAPQKDECLEKMEAEISRVKVFPNSQTHEGCLAHTEDNNLGNTSSLVQKIGSMPQVTDLSSDAIFIRNTAQTGEHAISSKSADAIDQFIVDFPKTSPSMADGENVCVAPSVAISAGTIEDHSIQTTSDSDQTTHGNGNVGTVAEQENLSEDVDHQLDDRVSISDTEKLSVKEKNSEGQGDEVISDHVVDSFKLVVETCSSMHISNEPQMCDDRKEMHKDVESHSFVGCSSSLLVQSQQISAQMLTNTGSSVDYLNYPDAATHEKETGTFSVDSELSGVGPEVVNLGPDKVVDDVDGLDCLGASRLGRFPTDSELGRVASEVVNIASEKVLDSVHNVLLRSNIANHESTHDKKGLDSPSDVHSSLSPKQEETGTTISLLDAKESYQVSYEKVTYPESECGKSSDEPKEMSAGIVCQSSFSLGTFGKMSQNEPASDVAKTNSQSQFSTGLEECSVIDDAALKVKESAEICAKYQILVPIEAEVIRPSHEESSEHPLPPALVEISDHNESNNPENNGDLEINNGVGTVLASTKVIRPSHEESSERPLPPALVETSNHTESNNLENNGASEINNGVGTVLASTEGLHLNHEETPRHPLPSSLLEAPHDIVVKDVENNEASKTNNGLQAAFAVTEVVSWNGLEGTCGPTAMSEAEAQVVEAETCSHHSYGPSHASPIVISCTETSRSEKNHRQKSTGSADNVDADSFELEVNKVDEANCGSPTIISCNKTSQSDKDSRQRRMGSMDHSDSDALDRGANRVMDGAVDPKEDATFDNDGSFSFKVPCNPKSEPIDQSTANGETVGETNPQNNEQYGGKEQKKEARSLDQNTAVSSNMEQLAVVDVLPDQDPKQNTAAEVDRNVALEASQNADPSETETGSKRKAVHSIQPNEFIQTARLFHPTSSTCQIDAKVVQDIPPVFHPVMTNVTNASQTVGNSADGETKSSSGMTYKENDNEQDVLENTSSVKRTEASMRNTFPISSASVAQVVQAGEVQAVGFTQGSTIKSSAVSTVSTAQISSLPDLNSLTSSQIFTEQCFTDFQQVQLRSQIFVYGSIIQGTAPNETFMQAAFGGSDGGRREWEKVWRVAVERHHNQKSPLSNAKTTFSNSKTPVHRNIDARVADATRQTVHQSESVCTPGGAETMKFSPVVLNPNMSFSSPIWTPATCRDGQLSSSMPKGPLVDSSKKFLPLQPLQSPHMRHYVGNTSSWMTQVPSPGTWVVNQNATFDASGHYSTLPICETVRVTSVREPSAPHCSGKQHAPPNSAIHTRSPNSAVRKSLVLDAKKTTGSPTKQASAESKPRKKRRNAASEESGKLSFLPSQTVPVSVSQSLASFATATIISGLNDGSSSGISGNSLVSSPMNTLSQRPKIVATTATTSTSAVSGGLSSPVSFVMKDAPLLTSSAITTAVSSSLNVASGSLTSGNSLVSSAQDQILGLGETKLRVSFSEKTSGEIGQAKRHAEEAAANAATAVRHCQSIWSQLSIQKNSGVISEIEAKLGSSAVSIAAAASVAKAAAAVAKIASDAALEAKLMADEALVACKSRNPSPENSLCDDAKNLGSVGPSSILKGSSKTNNADPVLVSAREAAKKRVETASAAAKRAENLDSVLKATEMTAEAVSQVGTIIAMGEPLPFTLPELVDAGPEGYWKVYRKSSEQLVKSNNVLPQETSKHGVVSVEEFSEKLSNKNDTRETLESSKVSAENRMLLANGLTSGSVSTTDKDSESQKGSENELSKTITVTPESQVVLENVSIRMQNEEIQEHQLVSTSNGKKIEDGSLVEVRSNEEGLGTVWLSAKVLSSEDGKALVSYTEHIRHDGTSPSTEWVLLDDKENAPRIRFPHPMSVVKSDGAKKRNREARGDYTWSVGDRVDVLISNGWREGIITGKSKEDETKLTVNFPAQQETSIVRAWNLRPSLFWEDGKWIEWSRPGGSGYLSQERKPPKKSKLEDEVKRKDRTTKIPSIAESKKPEAQKPFMLSAKEKVFNVGKSSTKDVGKKPTGVQKEISSVNPNVPKAGKKRKFMDVSKVSRPSNFKSEKSEALGSVYSRDVASDSLSSKRKPSSDVAANLQNKGKTSHLAENLVKNNEKGAGLVNSTPSSVEPRRSNRKIQPTSRLLEGLQSSLTLSKFPAASHDRGTKAQQKIPRGRSK